MGKTKIDWASHSMNMITGCTPISLACKNCYAAKQTRTMQIEYKLPQYKEGFNKVVCHNYLLSQFNELPKRPKEPRKIFIGSMSDIFHKDVPTEFIERIFYGIEDNPQHIFMVLTKRSDRLVELADHLQWTNNLWCGVTVEHSDYLYRIDHLKQVPSKIRFLSLEPLLSPLGPLDLSGIHWVIVGGQSSCKGAVVPSIDWVRDIRDQCIDQNVPFFFKQWGGETKIILNSNGHLLDGETWRQYPNYDIMNHQ